MNVLIACEESQRVCKEFRELGHNAYSCDILDCSGGHLEWHIKDDALRIINGYSHGYGTPFFVTCDGVTHTTPKQWDLIIAHPPCTFLTVSGNRWFNEEKYGEKARIRKENREKAILFFLSFIYANCEKIAVENPIGIMSTLYRKPDQIIQPWQFGDRARKSTCLWLKNLPKLTPTDVVDPGEILYGGYSVGAHADGRGNDGKYLRYNDPELARLRSKTFPGIAKAMASQWGGKK